MSSKGFARRLNVACAGWGFDSVTLAKRAGVFLPVVRDALSGVGDLPEASDLKRLRDALHVYEQWLTRGDISMVPLWEMSVADQHRVQNGPGSGGLSGYVIVRPGPWFMDEDGE